MDNKKYYYLKLKENFFDNEDIKLLEAQENGYIYSNLYLKLCLISLKNEGKLKYKDMLPYDEKMLSVITGMQIDHIRAGLVVLCKMGFIDILDDGTIYMSDIQLLIGHGSTEGERKALYREKIEKHKQLASGTMSGQSTGQITPELELEIKKELEISKKEEQPDRQEPVISDIPKELQGCTTRKHFEGKGGPLHRFCKLFRQKWYCNDDPKFCMKYFNEVSGYMKKSGIDEGSAAYWGAFQNQIVQRLNRDDVHRDVKDRDNDMGVFGR